MLAPPAVTAVAGTYGTPLGSHAAGTVRGRMVGDDAVLSVDLPIGPDGDAIVRAFEDTRAVLARPYLDANASRSSVKSTADRIKALAEIGQRSADANVRVYSRPVLRSVVVGTTDARTGWPDAELVRTPDELMPESRAAPTRRRWIMR